MRKAGVDALWQTLNLRYVNAVLHQLPNCVSDHPKTYNFEHRADLDVTRPDGTLHWNPRPKPHSRPMVAADNAGHSGLSRRAAR